MSHAEHSYPWPRRPILNCEAPLLRRFSDSAEPSLARARSALLQKMAAAAADLRQQAKEEVFKEVVLCLRKLGLTLRDAESLLKKAEAADPFLWEKAAGDAGVVLAAAMKARL